MAAGGAVVLSVLSYPAWTLGRDVNSEQINIVTTMVENGTVSEARIEGVG